MWIHGEVVPAKERIFSLFEEHTELIKRGRRSKPVEFGHMIPLGQTQEKFITQYLVLRKKIIERQLPERILEEHETNFGKMPDELAEDKGFRGDKEAMAKLWKKGNSLPK